MSQTPHTSCHCHGESRTGHAAAWMEMVTLLAVATFLAFSYATGRLTAFLAPAYVWLTPAAAAVLYAMLLARGAAYFRGQGEAHEACHDAAEEHHADEEHHHGWHLPTAGCMVVLLVPIVLAVWINPQRLSAEGARKRRIPTPPRNVKLERAMAWVLGQTAADEPAGEAPDALSPNPTVLDLLDAVDVRGGEAIEGRFVTMTGQCDLGGASGEDPAGRFDLYRLVVTCCIADATSVSVEVAPPAGSRLDPGGWVRIGGIIRFDNPEDPAQPVIHAATLSRIPEPSKPYL